jgi:DUF177 domain-containing protein
MLVNIDEIKEGGLQRAWDIAGEAVDEMVKGDPAGYRAKGSLHIESDLRKMARRVLFQARGRAPLGVPCGRCLTPVAVDVPIEFDMTFVPADEVQARDEDSDEGHSTGRPKRTFAADEVNEETYSGKAIDLDPVVREQLLLALPSYPVCQESCKGLCPVCGTNLNERDCGCDRRVPDPRWAALEKLGKGEPGPSQSTKQKHRKG